MGHYHIFEAMKKKQLILFILPLFLLGCKHSAKQEAKQLLETSPSISFTFDDGITNDYPGFTFEEWNQMILTSLENEKLKAIFFVTGSNKLTKKGQFLLSSWNEKGHSIANHSYTHPNFNSPTNSSIVFERELLRTDSIISSYSNYIKLFRFPYLKEGKNDLKVDSIRTILKKHDYANGYVSIDASDWFVNSRLLKRIKEVGIEQTEIEKFKAFYIDHILERANYYENLSYTLNERHVDHTLLLHHNLTSALFLGDLINRFKEEGWEVTDAETAYQDEVFSIIPNPSYAGESLIWSMAKQSGAYEETLRYPAEDSRYEEPKMIELGL